MMKAFALMIVGTLAACGSEGKPGAGSAAGAAPAAGSAPAPAAAAPAAGSAPAPAAAATPAAGSAPAPAAATPAADASANEPLDAKTITRTSFGPYRAGEKVTQKMLDTMFGVRFKSGSRPADDSGEGDPTETPTWVAGGKVKMWVDKDGSRWETQGKQFHDVHGVGVGTSTKTLVEKVPELKCEYIADEEPTFACWVPAAPELHYIGMVGEQLEEEGFTKEKLAKAKLKVDILEWRPRRSR